MAKVTNNIFKDVDIRKLPVHSTPVGVTSSLFLTSPSTEYNEDGQYFIRLKLKTDSKDCKALVKLIDDARQAAFDEAMELLESAKEKKNLKLADPSYKEEEDDEGNPTGFTTFNFKRKAVRTDKKGGIKSVTIPIFDSMLQPIDKESIDLWAGTELSIAFKLCPYYTAQIGVGVSHRIEAVQIFKAVTSGSSRNAEDYGFQQVKGGFASQQATNDSDEEDEELEEEEAPKAHKKQRPAEGDDGDY